MFMQNLDSTVIATALPTMAKAFGADPVHMNVALTSYLLSLAVFIPASGWVADRYGARTVFRAAIAVFTIGSILCGRADSLAFLVVSRILQGIGGAMMVPVGRLTVVRTFNKSELIRAMSFVAIPGLIGPMLGPLAGGLIVGYLHWRVIFFVNLPIGIAGLYLVLRHLPDFRTEHSDPLDVVGLILFGSGIALLSYVLEIFGETSLSSREIIGLLALSASLLFGYVLHARTEKHPLLHLGLFRLRTFSCSVVGGFVTRLGSGGMPFLLPLLYQVGLGYSAVQSGLLIMPQPLAAMSLKLTMPKILARFGYRRVLVANTLLMGMLMMLFATVGPDTSVAVIVAQAFAYGFVSSLQFTSMNTLVYSDVPDRETSQASTMASTGQQMSLSFGVATASLTAALFIPDRTRASAVDMMHGTHQAFIVLGALTTLSSLVFFMLKATDGANVSMHRDQPV